MPSITRDPSTAPEVRDVTWLADALTERATAEQWQTQEWGAAQTVLECLLTDGTPTISPDRSRPIFALYALALCKDSICA